MMVFSCLMTIEGFYENRRSDGNFKCLNNWI